MPEDLEPVEVLVGSSVVDGIVRVPHEDITAADAHLFARSYSFTGPNAVTWMDALAGSSDLMSCNEEYSRFDQDPDNLKKWEYPDPPALPGPPTPLGRPAETIYLRDAINYEGTSLSQTLDFGSEPRMVDSVARIEELPSELRANIWLALEAPRVLGARAILTSDNPGQPGRPASGLHPMKIFLDAGHTVGHHAWGKDCSSSYVQNRDWHDIKLFYDLCPDARDDAIREYGLPSSDSIPFRPAIDELLVDVGFHQSNRISQDCYRLNGQIVPKFGGHAEEGISGCEICSSNKLILADPSVLAIISRDEVVSWPARASCWLQLAVKQILNGKTSPGPGDTLTHPVYRPASADLLDRFRKVTLRQKLRIFRRLRWSGGADIMDPDPTGYMELGTLLQKVLPRLETLAIRIDPMRDWKEPDQRQVNTKSCNVYDSRRVWLLDGLTAAGKHDPRCDIPVDVDTGRVSCDCQLLPFHRMKRLDIRVCTKKKFTFLHGGGSNRTRGWRHRSFARRPREEYFTLRSGEDGVVVCPKGVAPLSCHSLESCERNPETSLERFKDPRGYELYHQEHLWGPPASDLWHLLNRPDSPEPEGTD